MSTEYNDFIISTISKSSPTVANILQKEVNRQKNTIELIASENYISDAIMAANGSPFLLKYTEGYSPNKELGNKGRYYGGCQFFDELEDYACKKLQEAFQTDYYVNVQPHSGSSANMEAYSAVLQPGDTILSMDLNSGGHLSHASPVSFVGRTYNVVTYNTDINGLLDYGAIMQKARYYHPKAIICGASAYPRIIDFSAFRKIADNVGAYLICDIAHIAGLVIAGDHPSPFEANADIVTMTSQKTFRASRGGIIFCKSELAKAVDSAVFPRYQGGSLQQAIAGKAVGAEEACTDEYKKYIHQVVKNTWAMCNEFIKMGYDIVTGGTDNHLFLIDLTKQGISGKSLQEACDKENITLNKNCVPNETRSPKETSGVRIGCAAETTKGKTEEDFIGIAHRIDKIIKELKNS